MLKTTAMKITKKNHHIAVACLSPYFGVVPLENNLGKYLVINEFETKTLKGRFKGQGTKPYLVVSNNCMMEVHFNKRYKFVDKEKKNEFAEVTRY